MDHKVTKQKKLEKELNLKISEDVYSNRIFVEFSSDDRKLVLQRSFQNTYFGQKESVEFSKSLKNLKDLQNRLGYNRNNKV